LIVVKRMGTRTGAPRRALGCAVLLSALLTIAAPNLAEANANSFGGGWFMLLARGSFESVNPRLSKLRWRFDGHARFWEDTGGYGQSIVGPAIGWATSDSLTTYLGYGWIRTSPATGADVDEHRIWQQLMWNHRFEHVGFISRTRLEQRFVVNGNQVGWRIRQFFKLTYRMPFLERLALVGYDELFLALNDTDWGAKTGFDQNRLFVGPQWTFDSNGRLKAEIGYLNRYVDNPIGTDRIEHLVSVNVFLGF
jgi:hypothetical protein